MRYNSLNKIITITVLSKISSHKLNLIKGNGKLNAASEMLQKADLSSTI